MLGHVRPGAVSPKRGVVLTDIHSHLLIVNKPLSLSLSLFLRLRLTVGWALIPPLSGYHVPADGSGKEERLVVERDW